MMIWPPTADKILSKKGIILTDRQSKIETDLPDLQLTKTLSLTNNKIIVNGQEYQFENLKDSKKVVYLDLVEASKKLSTASIKVLRKII